MKNREITTTITYNKNCHYNESSKSQSTFVPLVAPALSIESITITNISNPNAISNNQPIFYYNDIIQVTITIPNITYGSVSFYFIDKTDLSQTPQLINSDPIEIDNDGNASIQYIPHNHGTFRIEYYGDPYYDDAVIEKQIDLTSRPAYIKFDEYPPYLINPQETVEMSVTVVDELTNEPLNYGLVTFLNYYDYNQRIEKIIGNSKYLINGQAYIRYSPIQLDHSNDLLRNIELIRASYNYNKTEYDVFWDYYSMHDDWTSIAIRRANQVNILIPQILDGTTYKSLNINDEALFVATQQDSLLLRCEITVTEELDTTSTSEEKKVVLADVKFVIEGKQHEYTDGILHEIPYQKEFIATYDQHQYYECSITNNDPLPQGLYKIYAVVDNVVQDGQTIPVNNYTNTSLPTDTNTGKNIVNGLYLKSNISEEFYIKIQPETNDKINLILNNQRPLVTNHTINSSDLKVEISGNLTEIDREILTGQTCYFYISGINKHLQGTIINDHGILMAKPTNVNSINIDTLGDYIIQAYIKDGDYRKKINNQMVIRHYNTTYSNNIIVKIRNQLKITLTKNIINNIYPGNIKYNIKGENISSNDVIQVEMFIDNESIGQHNLTLSSPAIQQKSIPPQSVGQHTLKAVVLNEEFNLSPVELNFTISTANLNITLDPDSKSVYSASPTDIFLNIEHVNKFNIGDIDLSKLDIKIIHSSEKEQQIQFAQDQENILIKINNKRYQVRVPCKLYDEGKWKIIADYKGDNCYNKIENNIITFDVINKIPSLIKQSLDENSIINLVYDIQNIQYKTEQDSEGNNIQVPEITYEPCNQKLLVLNTIYKNNTNPIRFVSITNDNGEYTLQRPNDLEQSNYISETEWTQYNTLEYQVLPKNEIINAFENLTTGATDEEIIETFINFFNDFNELQYIVNPNEYNNILQLYQQAQNDDFITLFYGYGETSGEITLFGDEDNGS